MATLPSTSADERELRATTPARPAATWPSPPVGLDPDRLVWAETVHGGTSTHLAIARGTTMRLTDLDGDACAHVLVYNAHDPVERLSVADTVRLQRGETLTAGCVLVSDHGRALATIVRDTSGRHDCVFGTTDPARARRETSVGGQASDGVGGTASDGAVVRTAGELLATAIAKHELHAPCGPRGVTPSIAFFRGVAVDDDGAPRFLGSAAPGASLTIRAELPLIVLIANAPHPLDARVPRSCGRLEILAWRDEPTAPDDPQWSGTPEIRRAYLATTISLAARLGR